MSYQLRGCLVRKNITFKKPMRCPAANDIEPALVFTIREAVQNKREDSKYQEL